jgi:oxygen-dependent protoporphyrinogen oxidase
MEGSEAAIIELVREDYRRFMDITAPPLFSTVHKWPDSMPQYVVGHAQRQGNLAANLRMYPGLKFVGNAYDGVGIPDCIRRANEAAKQIVGERV